MSTTALPFEPWCADYHKVMAATAEVAQAVCKGASVLRLAKDLWVVDRRFGNLLKDFNQIDAVPIEELGKVADRLGELHSKIVYVIDSTNRRGYTNRTMTAGSIRSIELKNEELAELIDGFRLSMNPDFQKDLSESWEEYKRELVVDNR